MPPGASRTASRSTSSCSLPMRSTGWQAAGHVDPDSRVDRGAFGRGDRGGSRARRGPMSALKRRVRDAVLAARSIGYSTGPSGSHLSRLFERWGIAETHRATHRAGAARRSGRRARRARGSRAGFPAVERIDAPAGNRCDRPYACGSSDRHRLFSRHMYGIREERCREGVPFFSGFVTMRSEPS